MILKRPLIIFDLETTGLDVTTARIVEIACVKIDVDGTQTDKYALINPTIPISKEASDVHKITDEMVKDKPKFIEISKSLFSFFYGCDIGGFNSDFYDIPILAEEFSRCNIAFGEWEMNTIDVYKIETLLRPNKLSDVYKRWTGKNLDDSHSAIADVNATVEILFHQYENKEEITPEEIEQFYRQKKRYDLSNKMYIDNDGIVRWNFGKHINQPIDVDRSYVNWILNQNSFTQETKNKILKYLNK